MLYNINKLLLSFLFFSSMGQGGATNPKYARFLSTIFCAFYNQVAYLPLFSEFFLSG